MKSKTFSGPKKGYYFCSGPQGLGYYKDEPREVTYKPSQVMSNRSRRKAEKEEEEQRRRMMMSGKGRKLLSKMEYGIQRKRENAKELMARRKTFKK